MTWQPPSWLVELGKVVWVVLSWAWNLFMWGGDIIASKAGEGSRLLYAIILLVMIPSLALTWLFARSQASIESMQAFFTAFFFRALAIGFITFLIIAVLSQM